MLRTVPLQPEKEAASPQPVVGTRVCLVQGHLSGQLPTPKLRAGLRAARPDGVLAMWAEMTPLQGARSRWRAKRASSQGSVGWDYSENIPHHKSHIICGGAENLLPSRGFLMEFWNFLWGQ